MSNICSDNLLYILGGLLIPMEIESQRGDVAMSSHSCTVVSVKDVSVPFFPQKLTYLHWEKKEECEQENSLVLAEGHHRGI